MECELNFEIQGPEEIRCDNGKWTEPPKCIGERGHLTSALPGKRLARPAKCSLLLKLCLSEEKKVACEEPPLVENGAVRLPSEGYHSGDRVAYVCSSGFFLRGPKEIICHRGRWTHPPECVGTHEVTSQLSLRGQVFRFLFNPHPYS